MTRYLVTGAAGNLGSHVVELLLAQGESVRAFVLEGDPAAAELPPQVERIYGDVTRREDVQRFLDLPPEDDAIVIHAAGIVTIYPEFNQRVYDVNVTGTENVVAECVRRRVKKLVYVCSVHAITPLPDGRQMTEPERYDPEKLDGFYGKTKAEAARLVQRAVKEDGLNASIVFPSGLCGPGDTTGGHVTNLIRQCLFGRLPVGVKGAYDFSDIRDVARGVILAAQRGGKGENYILSNLCISVREILRILHQRTGCREVKTMLPLWLAKLGAPFCEVYYRAKKRTPLFTRYALSTLGENANFSCAKARKELGYTVRPFADTVADTAAWLKEKAKQKRR